MKTSEFHRRLVELGRRHGPVPRYGTPEWEALPDGDPRVFAAVVIAAECWRRDGTPEAIAARLRQELEESDRLVLYRQFGAERDVHAAWMEQPARRRVWRPSNAVMQRRRNELVSGPEDQQREQGS
ncbi:MAG TPA: DUF2742 domain-containing protein [Jiangellaceae bacterium]